MQSKLYSQTLIIIFNMIVKQGEIKFDGGYKAAVISWVLWSIEISFRGKEFCFASFHLHSAVKTLSYSCIKICCKEQISWQISKDTTLGTDAHVKISQR